MLVKSYIEESMDTNDYLYWYSECATVHLSAAMNENFYMLYGEIHSLNKYRYLINSENTFQKTREEKTELDKILERFDHEHDESD
jgi:hypothetical protein